MIFQTDSMYFEQGRYIIELQSKYLYSYDNEEGDEDEKMASNCIGLH